MEGDHSLPGGVECGRRIIVIDPKDGSVLQICDVGKEIPVGDVLLDIVMFGGFLFAVSRLPARRVEGAVGRGRAKRARGSCARGSLFDVDVGRRVVVGAANSAPRPHIRMQPNAPADAPERPAGPTLLRQISKQHSHKSSIDLFREINSEREEAPEAEQPRNGRYTEGQAPSHGARPRGKTGLMKKRNHAHESIAALVVQALPHGRAST